MSTIIESPVVRLEDGEIDEKDGGGPSGLCTPSTGGCIGGVRREGVVNAENKTDNHGKTPDKMAIGKYELAHPTKRQELVSSTHKSMYTNENDSEFVYEDEMLCVRGASPVPFPTNSSYFSRHSPKYESDTFSDDIKTPKRRKTSRKMHRKKRRSNRKKISKDRSASSSDDQNISKSKVETELPHRPKLQQVCKFYLLEWCAKGHCCEYMHSEFPCKFFYMGLQCEDEVTNGKCKLSHGGALSHEMLIALIRHIHTAPNNVLGKKFVELRSKMAAGEASKLLHEMQTKLQSPAKATDSMTAESNADFMEILRKKLYFLSEEQIDKLQTLRISKAEDLLSLTLAQLNAIGIHAIQIEAFQMSLIAGQDMDMRNILPPPMMVPPKPAEVVEQPEEVIELGCNDANWYDEEQPLVIDESEDADREKIKSDADDDDEVIDVVGCSSSSEFSHLLSSDDEKQKPDISSLISKLDQISEESSIEFEDVNKPTSNARLSIEVDGNDIKSPTNTTPVSETKTEPGQTAETQMEVDMSSDDWDLDELQLPGTHVDGVEGIYSPECADEGNSALLSNNGTCPGLPMRTPNLENYKPALEIDAHLTYPPMEYKLYSISLPDTEVNKPPLLDKLLKANSTDPRLKKFLEKEKNHGIFPQTDYSFFPPQSDPRLRSNPPTNCPTQCYNSTPIIYGYLQGSRWYQELKSNLKIEINHSVSNLVRALNAFHKDPSPKKIFDLFQIESAGVLLEVMRNVGIFIDVNGNITEERDYPQLCAPQQAVQSYNNNDGKNIVNGISSDDDNCRGGRSGEAPPLKPGLLGFAPPGIRYQPPHITQSNNEYNFMRQAFGNNCFGNNNNEFQPPGSGFYVNEWDFKRKRESGAFPRPPNKWNLKRRV